MRKAFEVALYLTAVDRWSSVVNNAFRSTSGALDKIQSKSGRVAHVAGRVATGAGVAAGAILAPLAAMTNDAIQFEDKMADVAKVLNMKTGSKELENMGRTVRNTSNIIAKMPEDTAAMYAGLAQGGVKLNELTEAAERAGKMSIAFDIEAGISGDRLVKTRNALGATLAETNRVMDAVNHLSDNTAAKASQVLDFLGAGGAAISRTLKITGQESAALGSVFISMGKSGEESATILERMTKGVMNMDKQVGKIYSKAGGGLPGILAVMEAGAKLDGGEKFKFFKAFGEYGNDIAQFSNNFGMLQEHLKLIGNAQNYAGSVEREFQNRMGTTAVKMQQARVQFKNLSIEAGQALLPAINDVLGAIMPLIQRLSKWMQANPKMVAGIMKFAAVLGIIAAAIAVVSTIVSGVAAVIGVVSAPVLAIIAAIAVAAYLIIANWSKIVGFFKGLWEKVKAIFWAFVEANKQLAAKFYNAGRNIVLNIWNGIKSLAMKPVQAIKAIVKKIRDFLPFSPAKVGPLRDIHKIRLVETIAQTIRPKPLVDAMSGTMGAAFGGPQRSSLAMATPGGGGAVTVNFSPSITVTGGDPGGADQSIIAALRKYEPEFLRFLDNALRKRERSNY